MGHDDAVAEQIHRLRDDRAGFDRGGRLEQICRIEHDLDARRAEAVDQPPRLLGRRHDVGQLRLDAEVDAALFGEQDCLGHFHQQIVPGLDACIVRMMRPLVGRVARAGAQRDQPRAHERRRADQRSKTGKAVGADRGIGMDHVVGARHAADRQRRTRRSPRLSPRTSAGAIVSGMEAPPSTAMLNWTTS